MSRCWSCATPAVSMSMAAALEIGGRCVAFNVAEDGCPMDPRLVRRDLGGNMRKLRAGSFGARIGSGRMAQVRRPHGPEAQPGEHRGRVCDTVDRIRKPLLRDSCARRHSPTLVHCCLESEDWPLWVDGVRADLGMACRAGAGETGRSLGNAHAAAHAVLSRHCRDGRDRTRPGTMAFRDMS